MHLADAFIQSDLQCIQAIHFIFFSMCVPWESNPQPLRCWRNALTTEPQEHWVTAQKVGLKHLTQLLVENNSACVLSNIYQALGCI